MIQVLNKSDVNKFTNALECKDRCLCVFVFLVIWFVNSLGGINGHVVIVIVIVVVVISCLSSLVLFCCLLYLFLNSLLSYLYVDLNDFINDSSRLSSGYIGLIKLNLV
jgi:hypothetical protein